ncbi:MAG TPA: protein-methionine-sulfoxide reductase heme-binding subunit MsrQ [Gammaproteobacteria bacterium]|nr:protein-methionine-sulfoxide reductase heme-binding subunit MsrQ [Gammaproteobacteria bacterium]
MTRRLVYIKTLVWAACLAPLTLLVLRANGVWSLSLGANPVEEVLNVCGKTALNLILLTLCITPIRRSTGVNRLIAFRRLLGLFAFFYLVLHFLVYLFLDRAMEWGTIIDDVAERPYITVGFAALLMMIPLAATSTNALQRKLGRNWGRLHRLIYAIGVLGVVHFWWQVKLDVAEPLLYAVLLTVLLGVRIQHRRELNAKRRRTSVDAKTTMAPTYQRVEPP